MPIKIFTTIDGPCPFGTGHAIDSTGCRKCQYFYRTGTAMFFWCSHPVEQKLENVRKSNKSVSKTAQSVPKTRKSVPKTTKTGTRIKKRGQTPKKGKESRIKVIKQSIK